jgi:hypothetical protein
MLLRYSKIISNIPYKGDMIFYWKFETVQPDILVEPGNPDKYSWS